MLEEHTVREPTWIRTLVDDVVMEAITPLGTIGPLGFRYWPPGQEDNTFDGWQVVIYPTPNEVRGPVPGDGCKTVSGFKLDVARIIGVMNHVDSVVWMSPVRYNGDLDGPEVSLRGTFIGKRVWLRFFHLPPADEPCTTAVNPATGQTTTL